VIVTFAQKRSEANVVVEYEVLEQPLESKDIQQLVADLEADQILEHTPGSTNFKKAIRDDKDRRLVVIDFTRLAVPSGVEQARQYSMVVGKKMYRITCSSSPTLFAKYDPIFEHMVASFKPIPVGSGD